MITATVVKMPVARLSICACGFFALSEDIQLGTEYTLVPADKQTVLFICGGCGQEQHIEAVQCFNRDGTNNGGYIPSELFDL